MRNLIKSVSLVFPRLTETNVSQANGSPSKQSSETRKGKEPIEDDWARSTQGDVSDKTASKDEDGGPERSTCLVDV